MASGVLESFEAARPARWSPRSDLTCTPIQTHRLTAADDLADVLRRYVTTDDAVAVVISEKAAVMACGLAVPASMYPAGRLARLLVRFVRPRPGSRGISVPAKMQYVLSHTGATRVLLAAVASAITRPLGIRGTFYLVAGSLARDLDGGRPPFDNLLFPPMPSAVADQVCNRLAVELGYPVAIVDINDFGGSIRGVSRGGPGKRVLLRALADNPLGQRDAGTPVGVLR